MPKSKFFRAVVEGATSDGRLIPRQHIVEMAESYNPTFRGARANLEHIKSVLPDSPFRAYGDITAAKYEEIKDGPLKGKLALLVQVDATDDLVKLRESRQKVYSSIEYVEKFADTGKAYLTGIAFTDTPASLGAEILTFCAQSANNPLASRKSQADAIFSVADEITLEFETETEQKPALFSQIKAMFTKKQTTDDARFSDVHQAVELVAQQLEEKLTALSTLETAFTALKADHAATQQALTELKTQLGKTDRQFSQRPAATGNENALLTDC
ncbi:precorrin-8W decarboxylase [Yersinia entomophaga]|uniref:Precorrin-8W decarboxylase n=1 Tax=Yersinia entomophaga TaxID=935293 RepID=A0ABM6BK99_YERET|nr:GPO family capsid scaffolding protein [Yersinia entomophaga]ANI30006.1 precorrin-8W decarboxylase [Yersinia entomophaga]